MSVCMKPDRSVKTRMSINSCATFHMGMGIVTVVRLVAIRFSHKKQKTVAVLHTPYVNKLSSLPAPKVIRFSDNSTQFLAV